MRAKPASAQASHRSTYLGGLFQNSIKVEKSQSVIIIYLLFHFVLIQKGWNVPGGLLSEHHGSHHHHPRFWDHHHQLHPHHPHHPHGYQHESLISGLSAGHEFWTSAAAAAAAAASTTSMSSGTSGGGNPVASSSSSGRTRYSKK